MALTDKAIKALKPRDKDFKVSDGGGLYLLVTKAGSKYWRLKYHIENKEKLMALGVYPEIPLKEARETAAEAKKLVRKGIDPVLDRKVRKQANTDLQNDSFKAISQEWFETRRSGWAEDTATRNSGLLENWVYPEFGDTPITSIGAKEVLVLLRKAEVQKKFEVARRLRSTVSQIFRYGIITERCDRDPAHDLIGALQTQPESNYAAITDPEGVSRLMGAIEGFEGTFVVKAALYLSALFFCRPGELRSLEWADVDYDNAQITIPAERMKMRRDHIIPLASQAIETLKDLEPITRRSKYIFPSARGASRNMSENAVRVALRTLGYTNDQMTAHGFRAMARTLLDEELEFPVDWIEHQLAHAVKDVNGRAYNRTAHLNQRRGMMQSWADYLDELKDKEKSGIKIERRYA